MLPGRANIVTGIGKNSCQLTAQNKLESQVKLIRHRPLGMPFVLEVPVGKVSTVGFFGFIRRDEVCWRRMSSL